MIVILDTNVLLSSLTALDSPPSILLERWYEDEFKVAASEATLAEINNVLGRPKWVARLANYTEKVDELLLRLRQYSYWPAEIIELPLLEFDPKDTAIVALALSSDAAFIVSGDKRLRANGPYGDISVITPREFLDILQARDEDTGAMIEGAGTP